MGSYYYWEAWLDVDGTGVFMAERTQYVIIRVHLSLPTLSITLWSLVTSLLSSDAGAARRSTPQSQGY